METTYTLPYNIRLPVGSNQLQWTFGGSASKQHVNRPLFAT